VRTNEGKSARERLGSKLDPKLREWLDRVIVPAIAREYVAEHKGTESVDVSPQGVRKFNSNDRLSAEGIQ
jgi:hypothetical protein